MHTLTTLWETLVRWWHPPLPVCQAPPAQMAPAAPIKRQLLRVTLTRTEATRLLDELAQLAEPPGHICGVMQTAHSPIVRLYIDVGRAPAAGIKLLLIGAGDVQKVEDVLSGDGFVRCCGEALRILLSKSTTPTTNLSQGGFSRCTCK